MNVVICTCPKDYAKLPFVIEGIRQNIAGNHQFHIFSEQKPENLSGADIIHHRDEDILPGVRELIEHRPNWFMAMFIKMFAGQYLETDHLVVDSDLILLKPINVFNTAKSRPNFILTKNQLHQPYFDFQKKYFHLSRVYEHSFISEIMFFSYYEVYELIKASSHAEYIDCAKWMARRITDNCYPADFELYGSFVYDRDPKMYGFEKVNFNVDIGRHNYVYDDAEIKAIIAANSDYDGITISSWGMN